MTMEIPPHSYQLVAFNTWMCLSKRCPGCPMFHSGGGANPVQVKLGMEKAMDFFDGLDENRLCCMIL